MLSHLLPPLQASHTKECMYTHILASSFMSGTARVMMKEVMMTFYPNSPILKQREGGMWESVSL